MAIQLRTSKRLITTMIRRIKSKVNHHERFFRLLYQEGYIPAEWMLLTNAQTEHMDSATIGLWYYHRWKIEPFWIYQECWSRDEVLATDRCNVDLASIVRRFDGMRMLGGLMADDNQESPRNAII